MLQLLMVCPITIWTRAFVCDWIIGRDSRNNYSMGSQSQLWIISVLCCPLFTIWTKKFYTDFSLFELMFTKAFHCLSKSFCGDWSCRATIQLWMVIRCTAKERGGDRGVGQMCCQFETGVGGWGRGMQKTRIFYIISSYLQHSSTSLLWELLESCTHWQVVKEELHHSVTGSSFMNSFHFLLLFACSNKLNGLQLEMIVNLYSLYSSYVQLE